MLRLLLETAHFLTVYKTLDCPDIAAITKLISYYQFSAADEQRGPYRMQQLAGSSDEDRRLDRYMCLGYVYEDRGADLEPDFDEALGSYRRASLMAPNGVTFINVSSCGTARALRQVLRLRQSGARQASMCAPC